MSTLVTLRAPNRDRLVDDVRQSIEEAILTGALKPGDRLIEMRLTEQLSVSRTTVREALLMLERQGLVVSIPRRGTFVQRLSPQDAIDIGCSRALLESFAVHLGYERLTDAVFAQLEAATESMGHCKLPQDIPQLVQLDTIFHRHIVTACASSRIIELWESLSGPIRALYLTTLEDRNPTIHDITDFHRQLIASLRSGDRQLASAAIVEHYVRDRAQPSISPAIASVIDTLTQQLA